MIRLTSAWSGEGIWINPDHIVDFGEGTCSNKTATYLTTVNHSEENTEPYHVIESPEKVARKVLEYKMLMVKMNSYYSGAAITAFKEFEEECLATVELVKISLFQLSGLEE